MPYNLRTFFRTLHATSRSQLFHRIDPAQSHAGWRWMALQPSVLYVQSPEQFGQRLVAEGMDADSAEYKTRLKGYTDRLVDMNRQRLTPDFPPYPATCFYPMNKKRKVGENWFTLPKEERSRLMIEH